MLIDIIGACASVVSFVMFLPSARKIWMNRNDPHALRGNSILMNILIVLNALLWFSYAYLTSAFWVGAPGLVNLPLALLSIYWILRARNTPVNVSELPQWEDDEMVFITAPPGYGSIVKPSPVALRNGVLFRGKKELETVRQQFPPRQP